jgi:hypothetical protein
MNGDIRYQDAENIDIVARAQRAYDAGLEAHAAGKAPTQFEATLPMWEMYRLVPTDHRDLHRDFIHD